MWAGLINLLNTASFKPSELSTVVSRVAGMIDRQILEPDKAHYSAPVSMLRDVPYFSS